MERVLKKTTNKSSWKDCGKISFEKNQITLTKPLINFYSLFYSHLTAKDPNLFKYIQNVQLANQPKYD